MSWGSRIDEGSAPVWGAFLIQNFVKLYALLTETAILILNVYEQMIRILESKMKKSSYMKNSIQKIFLIVLGFIVGIICKLL